MSYTLLDNRDKDLINQDINKVSEQYNIKNRFGSSIVLNDSADLPLMDMKLYGKTTQPTTTGKQLLTDLNGSRVDGTFNGIVVTINKDKSITMKGTATALVEWQFEIDKSTLSPNTEYILSGSPSGASDNTFFHCLIETASYGVTKEYGNGVKFNYPTIPKAIYYRINVSSGQTINATFYPMIRLASITDSTYEPFTGGLPSPNPQYPQPLESKGKRGNLFDYTNIVIRKTNDFTANLFTSEESTEFTVNKNKISGISANFIIVASPMNFEKGKTIYNNGYLGVRSYLIYDSEGNSVDYSTSSTSYTPTETFYGYIGFAINKNTQVTDAEMIFSYYPNLSYRSYSGQMEIESVVYGGNLWDEEYQTGYWQNNGYFVSNTNGYMSSKNPISVLPSKDYYIRLPKNMIKYILFLDSSENPISRSALGSNVNKITTPSNCRYIHFSTEINYGTTYNNDICINLYNDAINGTYEPYTKQSHISLVGEGLKGIPVTDASLATYTDENGQMWCADYVDCERGVLVQRVGVKNLADATYWSHISDWVNERAFYNEQILSDAVTVNGYSTIANIMSNRFIVGTPSLIITDENKIGQGANTLYLSVDGITTKEELVAYFAENETLVYYILADPIETPLSADEIASYKALHSNYKVTSVMNDCDAEMEIKYAGDAYTSGLSDVINKSIDNKVGNIDSKVLVNGAEYGIDRIQIEKTDGQLQLVFRAADGTRKGAINFDLAETTTE